MSVPLLGHHLRWGDTEYLPSQELRRLQVRVVSAKRGGDPVAWTRLQILGLSTRARPMSVIIPGALIPIGGVTTVLGPKVSRAFTLLPEQAGFIAHSMGMCMLLGGVLVLLGVASGETFTELIGLILAATGCVTYGLGVIIGLGVGGLVTGPMFIAIAVAATMRVLVGVQIARQVQNSTDADTSN